jgi:hypothetical protein
MMKKSPTYVECFVKSYYVSVKGKLIKLLLYILNIANLCSSTLSNICHKLSIKISFLYKDNSTAGILDIH